MLLPSDPAAAGPPATVGEPTRARDVRPVQPTIAAFPPAGERPAGTADRPHFDGGRRLSAQPLPERAGRASFQASARPPSPAGGFLAQVLGRYSGGEAAAAPAGSEAYRRAGAEPTLYGPAPVVFRLTV